MAEKQSFMRVDEVAQELGVSKSYAYKIVQKLNAELKSLGYLTISGRVNRKFFYEKLCYRRSRRGKERKRMKNVQIPYDLFVALVEYHLGYDDEYEDEIRQGLEQKLNALVRHELYAKYKTAPSPEEREQARQAYLDRRGVFPDFRW